MSLAFQRATPGDYLEFNLDCILDRDYGARELLRRPQCRSLRYGHGLRVLRFDLIAMAIFSAYTASPPPPSRTPAG